MKKLLILMLCIGASFAVKAQKLEGFICVLINEARVNFELDFSKANIHGMSEADFARYEKDWNKDMPAIIGGFVENLNEEIDGLVRFGHYPTAKYKLKVEVIEVSLNGNYDSDAYLLDNEGNTVAKITGLFAKGGVFGTKLNLIKDGSKHSGELLGEILHKALKRCNRH